jgi:hypothetical protein
MENGIFNSMKFILSNEDSRANFASLSTRQTFPILASTVKPEYNDHPWDLKNVAVMQRVV